MPKIDIPAESLKNLKPALIRAYLASTGWKERLDTPVYSTFMYQGREAVVPKDQDFGDYAYRVEELLDLVSGVKGMRPEYVFSEIINQNADNIFEYRYCPNNGDIGTIPVDSMRDILGANLDMTKYACKDLIDFSPYYNSKKSALGSRIADGLTLGLTLPGSYVIQILYPADCNGQVNLSGSYVQNKNVNDVCKQMEYAISTVARSAADGEERIGKNDRISYNFIASMLPLGMKNASIEVKRKSVSDESETSSSPVKLTERVMGQVKIMEENMRPPEMLEEMEFIGFFSNVSEPDMGGSTDASETEFRLKFISSTSQKLQTARVVLADSERSLAYKSMEKRKPVMLKGKLVGVGKSLLIRDVRDLKFGN